MLKTHRVLQVTWLLKLCVGRIIPPQLTISLLELWLTNACTAEDHTLENQERRSEITYCQNKFKLKREKFKEAGQLKQLISSIR